MGNKGLIKIPEYSLIEFNGSKFINAGDLEKFEKRDSYLFLKRSEYNVIHDYPCIGAYEERLTYSKIHGPFYEISEIPKFESNNIHREIKDKILEIPVLEGISASDLKEIIYLNFGTAYDEKSRDCLTFLSERLNLINSRKILEVANETLRTLRNKGLTSKSSINYELKHNDYILEFLLKDESVYPSLELRILGKKDTCLALMDSLPIKNIEEYFPLDFREVGIKDAKSEGFSYNFFIGKHKSITELLALDNMII